MRNRRSWLGLLAAVLTVLAFWWVQGDGGTTTQDPQASPTTARPTDTSSTSSDVPSLPTPTQTATVSPPTTSGTDPDSGLPIVAVSELPPEAHETIALIDQGGPFPYAQDGDTFRNDEGLLPDQPLGYYQEYTVETPGSDDRGARRIVAGSAGELYWTDDHYNSFFRIAR
jgi:ribonuclease T1